MNILFLLALASLFYLIPLIIGRAMMVVIWHNKKEEHLANVPTYFAIGTLFIFAVALLTQYALLPLKASLSFPTVFFGIVYVSTAISLIINFFKTKSFLRLFNRHVLSTLALTLLFSLVSYSIWTWKAPYSLNWDLYEHQTLVHSITQGHFSYFTSQLSDTFGFNSYPPVFHLLMAVSQFPAQLSPTQIVQYWNVIGFIHLWIVSLASYAFAFVVTKKKSLSMLSALIGTLTFESVIAFTSFFLLPQTLAAVVFITAFTALIWRKKNYVSLSPIEVTLLSIFLFLLHYVIGGAAAALLYGTFLYFQYKPKIEKLSEHTPLYEVLTLLVILAYFGSQFLQLNSLNHGEAASYIFSTSDKFTFMLQSYGMLLLLALPLGILDAIKSANWLKKYLLFISVAFILLFLSQLPYALKFFVLGRWFLLFFAAVGIWSLIEKLRFSISKKISIVLVTLFLSLILILNGLLWKQGLTVDQHTSHVSQDELTAAGFLKENYSNQNVLIISDPATQYILEGLSGINSPGGSFANTTTRQTLSLALADSNSEQVRSALSTIRDGIREPAARTFIVFSGRLFLWERATNDQKMSFDFNVWQSRELKLSDFQWLNQLNTTDFPVIYQNRSLQIRELR